MGVVHVLSHALDDAQRGDLIYGGDILVFTRVPPLAELCALTDQLIRAEFGELDPVRAQFALERDEYVARVESLQKQYRKHLAARDLFFAALAHLGVDISRTCWDWLQLRVLPHGEAHASRRTARLDFHRDTWASNVYAQTNWWTPIYPITAGRTISFYPVYWSSGLENTSGGWDLEEIRARQGGGAAPTSGPVVPEPSEPVDTGAELRVVLEPGDLLCFSGAHLHAGVPNHTGVARFSVEVRTVNVDDAASGRGAPNVDGAAPRVAFDWFRRVEDGTPLPQIITPVTSPMEDGARS